MKEEGGEDELRQGDRMNAARGRDDDITVGKSGLLDLRTNSSGGRLHPFELRTELENRFRSTFWQIPEDICPEQHLLPFLLLAWRSGPAGRTGVIARILLRRKQIRPEQELNPLLIDSRDLLDVFGLQRR